MKENHFSDLVFGKIIRYNRLLIIFMGIVI